MPSSRPFRKSSGPAGSYIPPPPRPSHHRRGSSSGSYSSSPGHGYGISMEHVPRTEEQRTKLYGTSTSNRHKKPEPSRQRTQSGTMMYSRRKTPMSSSVQRPVVQVPSASRTTSRPHDQTYPYRSGPSRPPNITVVPSGSDYSGRGPSRPAPPPAPPSRPPPPPAPPSRPADIIRDARLPPARPSPLAISRSRSHSRRSSPDSNDHDPR
jgi:hypothetical protein